MEIRWFPLRDFRHRANPAAGWPPDGGQTAPVRQPHDQTDDRPVDRPVDRLVESRAALVLAGGAGRRFGGPPGTKLVADLDGRPVVHRAVGTALEAGIGPVIVVCGALASSDPVWRPLTDPIGSASVPILVDNPDWAAGQMTSLRAGLARAAELGIDAVVVGLGDQPFVLASAWRAVAAATSPIAVATYDGRRSNPVRLHRSVWDLLPTDGDEGARALMRLRPDLVQPVACEGSPADIDTEGDLEPWQRS